MLKNNIYNIDREFDYATIKDIVIQSLEKIVKEEVIKNTVNIPQDTIFEDTDYSNNLNNLPAPPTPLLKLKIRNTTKYLNWRLSILKRDNFTCQICHASVKENKSLRLEVHHAKAFDEICKELWNVNNGISICYRCHKDEIKEYV